MLDLLSGSVLLMTAGPGPEGEKAGLSRPRAARPEGLALRPGRPRVQRPDACAAPETKGEPAWLGPGDSSGEISASGGVPGLRSAREQVQADRGRVPVRTDS